jgi:hypothetical protein
VMVVHVTMDQLVHVTIVANVTPTHMHVTTTLMALGHATTVVTQQHVWTRRHVTMVLEGIVTTIVIVVALIQVHVITALVVQEHVTTVVKLMDVQIVRHVTTTLVQTQIMEVVSIQAVSVVTQMHVTMDQKVHVTMDVRANVAQTHLHVTTMPLGKVHVTIVASHVPDQCIVDIVTLVVVQTVTMGTAHGQKVAHTHAQDHIIPQETAVPSILITMHARVHQDVL